MNVQRASAARSSAAGQCTASEAEKHRHYDKYYRNFAPFVTTLSGAVSKASAEALMRVMRDVAKGDSNALDWEPARWMEDMLHRLAVEMVKSVAVIATRAVMPPHPPPRRRGLFTTTAQCRAMPCRAVCHKV